MGYLSLWKVLEEMITDFRKRGMSVPAEVINDLRSAKTLINVLKADPSNLNTRQRIEDHLLSVESYLISEGHKAFGTSYVEEWLKRLNEAGEEVSEGEESMRFIPGVPRGCSWIRIKPLAEIPLKKLKALAEESHLSYKVQNDGYLLVYGEDEFLREFVRKMASKYRLKGHPKS